MSSSPSARTQVRRADPSLKERPSKESMRPFGLPRWIGVLLYGVFWIILLVPLVRRWRRRESWRWARLGIAAAGALALGVGLALPQPWATGAGAALLLASVMLPPLADPDHERKLQARHGADYFLNGGQFVDGQWPQVEEHGEDLPVPTRLYLLLKGRELLAVPVKGKGEARASLAVDDIRDIRVAGESYRPVYVSEAKDPPRREQQVDRSAKTLLELVLRDGGKLRFSYTGAFSKHLAETAAHAIYSVRRLGGADGVGGESPEVFHIVGR